MGDRLMKVREIRLGSYNTYRNFFDIVYFAGTTSPYILPKNCESGIISVEKTTLKAAERSTIKTEWAIILKKAIWSCHDIKADPFPFHHSIHLIVDTPKSNSTASNRELNVLLSPLADKGPLFFPSLPLHLKKLFDI